MRTVLYWAKNRTSHRSLKIIAVIVGSLAVLVALSVVWFWGSYGLATMPPSIAKQLPFAPFVINSSSSNDVTVSSYKYDPNSKVLSYIVRLKHNQQLTVSEQATPIDFNNIPSLYSNLINGLNQYDSLSTYNGIIYLTKPTGSYEVAIFNSSGVLVFIKSNSDSLSSLQWTKIIEMLTINKNIGA